MANESIIGIIPKNSSEEIRLSITEFRGKSFLDIRQFYLNDENQMAPTRKGIRLNFNQVAELYSLIEKIPSIELNKDGILSA